MTGSWSNVKSNDSSAVLFLFLLLPTIVAITLTLLQFSVANLEMQPMLLLSALLVSMPHFGLSFTTLFRKRKELSQKQSLGFILVLILLVTCFFIFLKAGGLVQLLIMVAFSLYQTVHYASQNYGISSYFLENTSHKPTLKLLCYLIGSAFLINLIIADFERVQLNTEVWKMFLDISLIFIFLACLLVAFRIFKKERIEKSPPLFLWGMANLIAWSIWAFGTKTFLMFFLLPVFHSFQYLPFSFKQNLAVNISKKNIYFEYLLWIVAGGIIVIGVNSLGLKIDQNKFLFAAILFINSLHIYADSLIWRKPLKR